MEKEFLKCAIMERVNTERAIMLRLIEMQEYRFLSFDAESAAMDAELRILMKKHGKEQILVSSSARAFFTVEDYVGAGFGPQDLSIASIICKKRQRE